MEQEYIKYINELDNDKKLKKNNLLINNEYLIHENLNANKMRFNSVFKDDKYGLTCIVFRMICSMNITNEKIVQSNELYRNLKKMNSNVSLNNTYIFAKYDNLNESIIHDIKGYCDKLITIVYLKKSPELVTDITIGSVGAYLKDDNKNRIFMNKEDFLYTINELDNSYKHSFSNNMDPCRIGIYDNCIVNYYSKNGKNIFNPKIISVKLDDIIKEFNEFMDLVENILKEI